MRSMSICFLIFIILLFFVASCDARKNPHSLRRRIKKTNENESSTATVAIDDILKFNGSDISTGTFGKKRKNREFYSLWTPWSRCTRKCKMSRTRHCMVTSQCGASIVKEERACIYRKACEKHTKIVAGRGKVREDVLEQEHFDTSSEFRVLYHLQSFYSDWTAWTPCSRTCITYRIRKCEVSNICSNKVLQEDALCYIDGTACEKLYNKRRRRKKKSSVVNENGNSKAVHPLSGLKCGMAQNFPVRLFVRIIGGKEAAKGSWPWQVTILNKYREPYCGGTLLSHAWVLTAAHCIRRKMIARVGEWDLVEDEGTEQESRVIESFIHPDYDVDTVNNDIALIQLKRPFEFNMYCQPACLPAAGDELPEQAAATILGWGKRKNTAIYGTDVLHQAIVPIVDTEKCKEVYEHYKITENMLCAGYAKGRVDSCAGDSGGPLLYKNKDKWTVYGITSFGEGCGKKAKYGVYAKVSKFTKWIRKTIYRNL